MQRNGLLRASLITCAVLLFGVAAAGLATQSDAEATGLIELAPFELPGYRYAGAIDLTPFGVGGRPPFTIGIAFAEDDVLVVGEAGSMRVLALTRDGELIYEHQVAQVPDPAELDAAYAQMGSWSRVARGFDDVIDVAAGSDGVVIASSRLSHRVYRVDSDGRITTTWAPPIDFDAGLTSVSFITTDSVSNVYYGEPFNCTIGVLRPDGTTGPIVGLESGGCSTQFADMKFYGDRIYVAATLAGYISGVTVYDLAGQHIEDIVVRDSSDQLVDDFEITGRVAIDPRGSLILITASLQEREGQPPQTVFSLLTVGPKGELLTATELPTTHSWIDIDIAPDGTLGVLYRDGTEILLFEPAGS